MTGLPDATAGVDATQLEQYAQQTQEELVKFADRSVGVEIVNQFWITNAVLLSVNTSQTSLETIASVNHVDRLFIPPEVGTAAGNGSFFNIQPDNKRTDIEMDGLIRSCVSFYRSLPPRWFARSVRQR